MSNGTLGSWRNPPLAYVVAEIVISPYYLLHDSIPLLQANLRDSYPRTLEGQEIAMPTGTPHRFWRMLSADETHGLHVSPRAISLHATSYVDSSEFLKRCEIVLNAIRDSKLPVFVERAGMRYVDLIVPKNEQSPSNYLHSGIQGFLPEGANSGGAVWIASFQLDGMVLNMKAGAPSPTGTILPPDLIPIPLKKPDIWLLAEERVTQKLETGFIDTDCLLDVKKQFAPDEIVLSLGRMQKAISATFTAAISDLALSEWK